MIGTETNCVICGEVFIKKKNNHKYCSESCRWKGTAQNRDEAAREKKRAQMREWCGDNRDKRRNYHYKRYYGLTLDEYNEMLQEQEGRCKICDELPKAHHRALAVDHDHKTGEIFGLLCTPCNKILIGRMRTPEMFEKAAEYLRKGTGRFVPEEWKKGQKKRRKRTPRKVKNEQP